MKSTEYPEGDFRAPVPVINPGHSYRSLTDKLTQIVLTKNTPLAWFGAMAVGFTLAPNSSGPRCYGVHSHLGWF